MKRLLILGIGNPLRGDDALGPMAAELLEHRLAGCAHVTVRAVHQLTPDLAGLLHEYDISLLVDARLGEEPGRCYLEHVQPGDILPSAFTHYVTPDQLCAITATLYGAPPDMLITGITSSSFEVGAPLSPEVAHALPDLLERIMALVPLREPSGRSALG